GWTAPHVAAYNGNRDCVNLLLSAPISAKGVGAKDIKGRTPAYLAILSGEKTCSSVLIKAAMATMGKENLWTALHLACLEGQVETVQALFSGPKGKTVAGQVNAKADYGLTPLFLATCRGSAALVKLLVERGAKPDMMDDSEKIPLHFA